VFSASAPVTRRDLQPLRPLPPRPACSSTSRRRQRLAAERSRRSVRGSACQRAPTPPSTRRLAPIDRHRTRPAPAPLAPPAAGSVYDRPAGLWARRHTVFWRVWRHRGR